jgi:hypothetical protein
MSTAEALAFRWQFCRAGYDITSEFYAEQDADLVRAWEGADGDFCLIEATRVDGGWELSGGDGGWLSLADRLYASPGDALAAYAARYDMTFREVS